MSDPLRTDAARDADDAATADRDARIEQLLLAGLDEYFTGNYEHAINLWTRVLFLDRHHDRARAYIERARSALAERQRELDELVHTGVNAYNGGEMDKARDLLTRAAHHGSDTAHVFLDRLNRVGTPGAVGEHAPPPAPARRSITRPLIASEPGRLRWLAAAAGAAVVAAVMLVGGLPIGTWLSELQSSAPPPAAVSPVLEPLPVVRASEAAIDRAHALRADGRLRDALRTLDTIDLADPFRGEADRLRADIQRDQLAAAGIATGPPGEGGITR